MELLGTSSLASHSGGGKSASADGEKISLVWFLQRKILYWTLQRTQASPWMQAVWQKAASPRRKQGLAHHDRKEKLLRRNKNQRLLEDARWVEIVKSKHCCCLCKFTQQMRPWHILVVTYLSFAMKPDTIPSLNKVILTENKRKKWQKSSLFPSHTPQFAIWPCVLNV